MALLQLSNKGSSLALVDANLLGDLLLETGLVLEGLDCLLQLALVSLDCLKTLVVGLVGVVKPDHQLVDLAFELLLDPQGISLGSLLSLQRGAHGVHGTGVIFASAGKLLFLLSHTPVNLLADLAELKSSTEDLVLLLLESSLGFLESCLQLLLLPS